ncbi:MarR family winged helix-turn-helix transcriptional regulator [Streptomyces sp. CRN 30]|uniref:MarR family winged helix-turn-helix transcriptional regulator n=1 Tax=Streptomyces sp. CRN 30 TaxID=3075613 RepID=UPI002A802F00|nr:MarR family transcriptional regulator [Streptomyces sp. CRN 30]
MAKGLPRDLPRLLSSAERLLTRWLAEVLAAQGCTVEEWRVMSLLADGRGHTMSDVAEHALMPAPSLSKLVDRMVSANLVHRRKDPGDGRRILAYLSPRGRATHQRVAALVEEGQAQLLDGQEWTGELAASLARLADHLDPDGDAQSRETISKSSASARAR